MLNVAKKLLLSLGMASLLFGCRSEFGYTKKSGKSPAVNYPQQSFRITADRTSLKVKGMSGSVVNLTAYCTLSGSKVIDWDLGDGNRKRGASISHEYASIGSYTVKAYCRGTKVLSDSIVISVSNQSYPGQNPSYPGQNPSYPGKTPVYDDATVPSQPVWQTEQYPYPTSSYPTYGK